MSPGPSGKTSRKSRETPKGVAAMLRKVRDNPGEPNIDAEAKGSALAFIAAVTAAKPPARPGEAKRILEMRELLAGVEAELDAGSITGALGAALSPAFLRCFDFSGAVASGVNRAQAMHGETGADTKAAWQAIVNRIAAKPGMGRSRAWGEAETETGSKQETMEKHGVINPIPAKRGPRKKLPPRP